MAPILREKDIAIPKSLQITEDSEDDEDFNPTPALPKKDRGEAISSKGIK